MSNPQESVIYSSPEIRLESHCENLKTFSLQDWGSALEPQGCMLVVPGMQKGLRGLGFVFVGGDLLGIQEFERNMFLNVAYQHTLTHLHP